MLYRIKLILSILLPFLLFVVVFGFILILNEQDIVNRTVKREAETVAMFMGYGFSESMTQPEKERISRILAMNTNILSLSVEKTSGEILYTFRNPALQNPSVSAALSFVIPATALTGENFLMRIDISPAVWEASVFIRKYLPYLLLGVLILLLFYLLVVILWTKPLMQANRILAKLEPATFIDSEIPKFPKTGETEIKQLYYHLNDLIYKLQDALKINRTQGMGLNIPSEQMDTIVELRTKEINRANENLKKMNDKIYTDLEMARRVQENLLPSARNFAERSEFRIAARFMFMDQLGGDLYDIIRAGKNGYGFVIADVSGHGVAPALISTMAKVSFNDNSGWNKDTAVICGEVNNELCKLIEGTDYYLTAFYSHLNLETGVFQYTNAGHHPIVLHRVSTGEIMQLTTRGTIVGAFMNAKYESKVINLMPDDRLLFYTDGLIEARNNRGAFYGMENLVKFIERSRDQKSDEVVDALVQDVREFCDNRPLEDDCTIFLVEFRSIVQKSSH